MHLDRDSLVIGLLAGAMIAGVGGMVLRRIRQAQLGMGAPDKPMTVKTSGTPREVMKAAAAAFRTCLFWTIALLLFLVVAGGLIYYLVVMLAE